MKMLCCRFDKCNGRDSGEMAQLLMVEIRDGAATDLGCQTEVIAEAEG